MTKNNYQIEEKPLITGEKPIKPHGMSSEKARRVKTRGHKKEYIYATLIGGKVIKGPRKADVMDSRGKIHSLKGGGEIKGGEGRKGKWQIFLHKASKFKKNTGFYGRDIFVKILKSYPKDYDDYQRQKERTKSKIIPYMKELRKYLTSYRKKYNFLDKAFFEKKVDYFVIYHEDTFYIYDRNEISKVFTKVLSVENNSTFQKVVFKYNDRIIGEIEVRTTDDGKYPSMLFNMLKLRAVDLLEKEIPKIEKLNPNLYTCGKAIDSLTL
ncbi:MAG: hypothetical protein FJZ16_07495 [Candidatus Omnitrophica bacterium]|nr:hypothetical protein [Candidatus Omnitrophota bacterium]